MKSIDLSGRPFHFIGIGGIGMSALAYVLTKRKIPVSGSDLRCNHITQRLEANGAQIFHRQAAQNLDVFGRRANPVVAASFNKATETATNGRVSGTPDFKSGACADRPAAVNRVEPLPQIVCSTAINSSNLEYQAALERGYPIFHRSDLLAALIKDYQSIAVAGTHGKTTTSSLIGYLLLRSGLDPTIIVGGEVSAWEGNARLGEGSWLVAEADESDGTLSKHAPTIGIVTNIELDHPDHYHDLEAVVATFQNFAAQCGTLIGCIDCTIVREKLKPQISYSLNGERGADYTVAQVIYDSRGSTAQVWERGELLGTLRLPLLGEHNLSNALAAVAVGRKLGLDFEVIAQALVSFGGAKRRFEIKGERNDITFIDDYAHHPSEIRATLAAARWQIGQNQKQRIVAIFQPHRYSRTLTFLEEFAQAFEDADLVIVTDIYSAGEVDRKQIGGHQVAAAITQYHNRVFYYQNLQLLCQKLTETLKPGDLALFLGAGNLNQIIPQVIGS